MAIIKKDGYTSDVTATHNGSGYQVERTYRVDNDDTTDDMEMRIVTSNVFPERGSAYSYQYPTMLLKSKQAEAQETNNFKWWLVTLSYDTLLDSDADADRATNPTSQPAQVSSSSSLEEKLVDVAYAKEGEISDADEPLFPIESTTGEPFPGVSSIIPVQEKTITVNRSNYNPDWELLSGTINKSSIRIAGTRVKAGQAMLKSIGATNNFDENGNLYYSISMIFQIRGNKNGFMTEVMNRGYFREGVGGKLDKIINADVTENTDDDGWDDPVTEPAKLDEDSSVISVSQRGEAHFLVFQDKRMASWSALPIVSQQSGRS